MNLGKQVILSAATMVVISGCSGSEGSAPERLASQTQPLAPANVALVAATPSDAGVQDANAALGDPNVVAKLRGIALGASSAAGVSSPTTMHAVAGADRQAVESILCGAVINDHAPVYVIKMVGGPFTASQHPPGAAAPQGSVLTLTIDAATYSIVDVGYVNVEPDLTQIGPLTVDLSVP